MLARAAALHAVLLLPFAACTALPFQGETAYERDVALPADVAAALTTAALRQQFPFADPSSCSAGAPAQRTPDGFRIVLEQNAAAAWLPVADHRLRIVATAGAPAVQIETEELDARHRLGSLDGAAIHRIVVVITAGERSTSCRVVASLPAAVSRCVGAAMDHTFALANDDRAPLLGLSEPNLRAFVRHRLLAAADDHLRFGRSRLAAERLHTANRFVDGDVVFQRALAVRAGRAGDVEFAREQLLQALLLARDPSTRADLARDLASLRMDAGLAAPVDGEAAEAWLHTVRRFHPEPARDYRRLGVVHAERQDVMGELACVLLAREHAAPDALFATANGAKLRRLPFDLGRRVRENRVAVTELVTEPLAPRDAAAAPLH